MLCCSVGCAGNGVDAALGRFRVVEEMNSVRYLSTHDAPNRSVRAQVLRSEKNRLSKAHAAGALAGDGQTETTPSDLQC
jgi:hypothetical protein